MVTNKNGRSYDKAALLRRLEAAEQQQPVPDRDGCVHIVLDRNALTLWNDAAVGEVVSEIMVDARKERPSQWLIHCRVTVGDLRSVQRKVRDYVMSLPE